MSGSVKMLFVRMAAVVGAVLFCCLGYEPRYGSLLVLVFVMTWFIFRSYDDWSTFLKRCVLTFPFVVLTGLSVYAFIGPDRWIYWYYGALVFDALLINARDVRAHYLVTLLSTTTLIFWESARNLWPANSTFCSYGFVFVFLFYGSYLLMLNGKRDGFKYGATLLKALVAALLIVLFFAFFMVSYRYMNRHNFSFETAFAFSCFLGVIFFVVFYNLGKDYFKANTLFKKGKIMQSLEGFLSDFKNSFEIYKKGKQ